MVMNNICRLLFIFILFPQFANSQVQNVDPVIDNGTLMLKLDLTRGGAISYLSLSGSTRSIVNIADEGRYIQQSYYAGRSVVRQSVEMISIFIAGKACGIPWAPLR